MGITQIFHETETLDWVDLAYDCVSLMWMHLNLIPNVN